MRTQYPPLMSGSMAMLLCGLLAGVSFGQLNKNKKKPAGQVADIPPEADLPSAEKSALPEKHP